MALIYFPTVPARPTMQMWAPRANFTHKVTSRDLVILGRTWMGLLTGVELLTSKNLRTISWDTTVLQVCLITLGKVRKKKCPTWSFLCKHNLGLCCEILSSQNHLLSSIHKAAVNILSFNHWKFMSRPLGCGQNTDMNEINSVLPALSKSSQNYPQIDLVIVTIHWLPKQLLQGAKFRFEREK